MCQLNSEQARRSVLKICFFYIHHIAASNACQKNVSRWQHYTVCVIQIIRKVFNLFKLKMVNKSKDKDFERDFNEKKRRKSSATGSSTLDQSSSSGILSGSKSTNVYSV